MNNLNNCNFEICETDYSNYIFDSLHFSIHRYPDSFLSLMRNLKQNRTFPPPGDYPDEQCIHAMRMIKGGLWFMAHPFDVSALHRDSKVITLSFAPIHECNLRCRYCFAQSGKTFKGKKRSMDDDTLKNAMNLLKRQFPACTAMRLEFVSGGEPLLNSRLIKSAIELAEELFEQVYIYIVTNGTLYDESMFQFLENRNAAIGISLDGEKGVHDANRVFADGSGTYGTVMQTVSKLFEAPIRTKQGKTIWAISVITTQTDSLVAVLEHAIAHGFDALEMRIARGDLTDTEFLNHSTLPRFKTLYKELTDYLLHCISQGDENPLIMITNESDSFGKFIRRLLSKTLTFYRCSAGKSKFSLTSTGEIYPCDSFVGVQEYRLGCLDELEDQIKDNAFCDRSVDEIEPCRNCGYRYLCAGDCYYSAYKNTGEIGCVDSIHCEMNLYLIGLAIHLVYTLQQNHTHLYRHVCKIVKYRKLLNPL